MWERITHTIRVQTDPPRHRYLPSSRTRTRGSWIQDFLGRRSFSGSGLAQEGQPGQTNARRNRATNSPSTKTTLVRSLPSPAGSVLRSRRLWLFGWAANFSRKKSEGVVCKTPHHTCWICSAESSAESISRFFPFFPFSSKLDLIRVVKLVPYPRVALLPFLRFLFLNQGLDEVTIFLADTYRACAVSLS